MKRAIIMGASSGIGLEVAKILRRDGWQIGVAARRSDLLQEHFPGAAIEAIDVTAADAPELLLSLIRRVGGVDLYFHSSGIGRQNPTLEPQTELDTVLTNGLGFASLIGTAYRYMAENGGGHIAAVTSVAGTKGLGVAASYSATKAFQNTYLQALEQQANADGLNIVFTDIRPGFVATALLGDSPGYPLLMSADSVAKQCVRAVRRRKHVAVIDGRWRIITAFWKLIPNWIWRRLTFLK